ncbi:unnamed protein product [Polarella glacialis]|uniref:Uncharacterized protein n=1 Tax=Polarella glacialis TaxID=89957 RepID=A0A813KPY1_POLGL|nr:unnamed protein product [Polarella glacialis]
MLFLAMPAASVHCSVHWTVGCLADRCAAFACLLVCFLSSFFVRPRCCCSVVVVVVVVAGVVACCCCCCRRRRCRLRRRCRCCVCCFCVVLLIGIAGCKPAEDDSMEFPK